MMTRSIFRFIFILIAVVGFSVQGKAQASPDSISAEQLTRAVQLWQQGKPVPAYASLDSVMTQPTTESNAALKIRAAIWTATYLQEQKKIKPASRFLDSALTWGQEFSKAEDLAKAYDAYAQWHVASGNVRPALNAQAAATGIRDSLKNTGLTRTADSLQQLLLQQQAAIQRDSSQVEKTETSTAANQNYITWILAAIIAVMLIILLRMNGVIQRMKSLPPAPKASAVKTPEPVTQPAEVKVKSTPVTSEPAPALPPSVPVNTGGKDLTSRLSEVELVLIRAETLGKYSNGEWKSVRNLLNEYLTQLPLILKNLDDAIAKNETAPILQALEYLKPYMQAFGMTNTLSLIREIDEEANEAKASKLLSRVFQIRNHTRRAADESKSILEKFS